MTRRFPDCFSACILFNMEQYSKHAILREATKAFVGFWRHPEETEYERKELLKHQDGETEAEKAMRLQQLDAITLERDSRDIATG